MPRQIIITPAGGSSQGVTGAVSYPAPRVPPLGIPAPSGSTWPIAFPLVNENPRQVLGFIPLISCDATECRTFNGSCYFNPVFGDVSYMYPLYENDFNSFLIDDSFARTNTQFIIQKMDRRFNTWSDQATINSNYGTVYPIGYYKKYPTYTGVSLNWGQVLRLHGAGFYRIKVGSGTFAPAPLPPTIEAVPSGGASLNFIHQRIFSPHITFTCSFTGTVSGLTTSIDNKGVITVTGTITGTCVVVESNGQTGTFNVVTGSPPVTNEIGDKISIANIPVSGTISGNGTCILRGNIDFSILESNGNGEGLSTQITVNTTVTVTDNIPEPTPSICMISEPFHLLPFNCNQANRTVKFEAYQTGRIGSITEEGYVYDLSGQAASGAFVQAIPPINWYDSVRVNGIFADETSQYDEVMLEYPSGLTERIRDENIRKYKWHSDLLPKYIHDRLKSYGLMADKLLVSDYNFSNPDYNIKRKHITKAGGYEPKPYRRNRMTSVSVDFKDGVQSLIKNIY